MPETDGQIRLKMLRQARDQTLKEWDVSFAINGEVLTNILGFITDINTDVPIKFYKDRIFVNLKSPDNTQYAEIDISSSDVLDYKPGLEGDPNRKDAKNVVKGPDGDYKPILVDIKGTLDEISPYAQKDDIVIIRVDTAYYKRIEFHCPDIIIWATLMDPTSVMKSMEKLPEIMRNVRNNTKIKKASAIIEPATFNKICNIGGKGGKKRDIDERIFIELGKEDGLYITSGDRLKGRYIRIAPTDVITSMAGDDLPSDQEYSEGTADLEEGVFEGMESAVPEEYSYAPGKNTGEQKLERKRPDQKTPLNQLLGIDVDDIPQYVYLNKEYLMPFAKLKGLSPIVVEVRTDKPIIIEQKPFNGITALLTVAPRIESDEDK
jgi:hypothetical protein